MQDDDRDSKQGIDDGVTEVHVLGQKVIRRTTARGGEVADMAEKKKGMAEFGDEDGGRRALNHRFGGCVS